MSEFFDNVPLKEPQTSGLQNSIARAFKRVEGRTFTRLEDTDLNFTVPTKTNLNFKQGAKTHLQVGNNTTPNIEPTPNVVRYGMRIEALDLDGAAESAALYCRIDPTEGTADQKIGFYFEVTDKQQDTEAAAMKAVHAGAGDCMYVACFNSGPSFESASFYNGNRGIISTNQFEQPGGGNDFSFSTLFQAVWGYDGTGGSTTPAAFGVYYCALSLGNSFRTRLQDPAETGFAWGRTEIAISEFDLARDRFQVYNNGLTRLLSTAATASSTTEPAPAFQQWGSFWNGSSADDKTILYEQALDGSGNPSLYIKMGDDGAETTELILSTTSLSLESNALSSVDSIELGYGSAVAPAVRFTSDSDTGVYGSAANVHVATSGAERLRIGDSSGFFFIDMDMQANDLLNVGVLRGEAASGAAPTFSFQADTDTGMYSPAANTISFATGGTPRMRIDSAGNVGVGTTNPRAKLLVSENTGSLTPNTLAETLALEATFTPGMTFLSVNTGTQSIYFADSDDDDVGQIVYTHTDNALAFTTNAAEAMRIDSSGQLGVGTTSPSHTIEVSGDIGVDDGTAANPTYTFASDTNTGIFRNAADSLAISSGGTERFRVNSSGMSILVGGDASRPLDINGDTMRLRNSRTISASTDAGFQGEICWDANYLYVYDGSGWNRIAWTSSSW